MVLFFQYSSCLLSFVWITSAAKSFIRKLHQFTRRHFMKYNAHIIDGPSDIPSLPVGYGFLSLVIHQSLESCLSPEVKHGNCRVPDSIEALCELGGRHMHIHPTLEDCRIGSFRRSLSNPAINWDWPCERSSRRLRDVRHVRLLL